MRDIQGRADGLLGQLGAMIAESARPERFEYRLCLWGEVNDAAREGFQVHQSGPWPMTVDWTDSGSGEQRQGVNPGFLMWRKLGPESEAEEILRRVQSGDVPVYEFPNEAAG